MRSTTFIIATSALTGAAASVEPLSSTGHSGQPHLDSQLGLSEIPSIGLGTWLSERDKVAHAVQYALDGGYTHIDAAMVYGNEDKVGEGIANSTAKREDIWVTSKLWNTDHRPSNVGKAIDKTIGDLGVGYLDLYLMHWPVAFNPESRQLDTGITIETTWRAMEDLVRAKKTRYIGVSNFSPVDLKRILDICEICPYAHEFETHPFLQQQEFVDWHIKEGIKVIAYSPLANTNPHYDSRIPPITDELYWTMTAFKKDCTVIQAILAWGRQRGTIVIPKSVHEDYIDDNIASLDISFSEQEMYDIYRQDRKVRFNDPGQEWGVSLFQGLDDPTGPVEANSEPRGVNLEL